MDRKLNHLEKFMLKKISDIDDFPSGAFNIRENGKGIRRNTTKNINIVSKEDKQGIDIFIKENTKNEMVHIPVILTESGFTDIVYNDFYIGKNADVTIVAGCGIHNDSCETSEHDGIHRFFLEEGAKVKYIEKHYGDGEGTGKRILNPQTIIELKDGSSLEMETVQIKGVDNAIRQTSGKLGNETNLVITEKIMTHGAQFARTEFDVVLDGKNASTHVISRAVAKDASKQEFVSKIEGNTECYGHVECDAIIMDHATVKAIPEILANNIDARLIHEATIGKIAGEQMTKLMTLGLSDKEAESEIINGFLK
ncbi:MAG: SufD family Fe-S cluster assembly protein [Clostridia bacterium]|nr:SufD family Fe-S cluster assembly protein [Clostridia bacterium]